MGQLGEGICVGILRVILATVKPSKPSLKPFHTSKLLKRLRSCPLVEHLPSRQGAFGLSFSTAQMYQGPGSGPVQA